MGGPAPFAPGRTFSARVARAQDEVVAAEKAIGLRHRVQVRNGASAAAPDPRLPWKGADVDEERLRRATASSLPGEIAGLRVPGSSPSLGTLQRPIGVGSGSRLTWPLSCNRVPL